MTGTNGKTTVTTLIKHMLEQCLHTKVGLIGTNANVIGDEVLHTEHTTPDAYELQKLLRRMVDAGCTHAVMEVSSHSLVLHRVEGIRFRVPRPRRSCLRRVTSASSTRTTIGRTSCSSTPNARCTPIPPNATTPTSWPRTSA